MTNDERNPNDEIRTGVLAEGFFVISHSGFLRHSSFVVRVSTLCGLVLLTPSTLLAAPDSAGQAGNARSPKAVAEVQSSKRSTANAAWWGFNEEDATDALQAAIRSGAKRVIVPNLG